MNKKKIYFFGTIVISILLVISIIYYIDSNMKKKSNLTKVKVQAGWLLNGEFANVCSAIVKDYYKDEGLDVEMIPGGPTGGSFVIATNSVAQNPDITLGIDGDMVPLLRGITKENENEKLKVKAFASFWQDVPFGFIVRKDSGLKSLKDFYNKKPDGSKYKIGVTADSIIQNAISNYTGKPVDDLDIVIVGFDATPFLTGQVDALAAYWTTQAYEVEKAGIQYNFLSASEIPGFKQPSQVVIASEKMLKDKPEILQKWLKATIKGTEYIINNPDNAAEQILDSRCGGNKLDVEQEKWLIKKTIPLFNGDQIGYIDKDQVVNFATTFYNLKQIPRIPDINELVDYSILNKMYKQ